ncbi:MAG TPA: DNA polymerase III subunit gamma/tau, partial [Clostridia bacterium]|nr:DNA polymerase III subunit gamma/tau [Clostridia bacterium]
APAPAPGPKPIRAEAPRVAAPAPPPRPSPEPASVSMREQPQAAAPAPAPAPAPADLTELWQNLLDAVGRVSPFTRTYLLEAHPVSFAKNLFTIGFDPQFEDHIGLVDNARNQTLLQTKLAEMGHPNAQIKFIKAENPFPKLSPPPSSPSPAPAPAAAPQKAPSAAPTQAKQAAPPPAPVKEKTAPVPFNKDEFKNDPLIQKALEIFKGQIVEVRA